MRPGGDVTNVRVAYRGIDGLQITRDGFLVVHTAFGELRESAPRLYQDIAGNQVPVEGRFKLTGDSAYTFEVKSYQRQYPLVIDPTLLYATYLGGSNGDYGSGIAVDSAGNTYVTGYTSSTNFPTTPGVIQPSGSGGAFVTKLNPLGNNLLYSTYLAYVDGPASQSSQSPPIAIAIDSSGSAYVTGWARPQFPTTATAYQTTCSAGCPFLAKLSPAADALVYSTYLGGGNSNITWPYGGAARGIAVDTAGRAYLVGTAACDLPTTPGAVQVTPGGCGHAAAYLNFDAAVSVIDPAASGNASLVYSTYLGGSGGDIGTAIAVDGFGAIYVTGSTSSTDFPVTPGAYQTILLGSNAFVAKINPAISGHSGLLYSTYLGGTGGSGGSGIAADALGNAYVTGSTAGTPTGTTPVPFPTTQGAYLSCSDNFVGDSWVFVTELNAAGNGLIYSTCLGGTPYAEQAPSGIALDSNGNASVTGYTRSSAFPVTSNAYESVWHGGEFTGFVTKFDSRGSTLLYSSFLGSSSGPDQTNTSPNAIAVDQSGDVYITGWTAATSFPVTPGAYQSMPKGNGDAFVTKFPLGGTFRVLQIVPTAGGNSGTFTATIYGSGFQAGAAVKLAGNPDIVATAVTIGPGALYVTATFDLQGTATGTRDVVVTNADGTILRLPQAFTIQQGAAVNGAIQVQKIGTKAVPGRDVTYSITMTNSANVDSSTLFVLEFVQPWFTFISANPTPTNTTEVSALWPPSNVGTEAMYDQWLEWDVPSLPAGSSRTFSYTVKLDGAFPVGDLVSGNVCTTAGARWSVCTLAGTACLEEGLAGCLLTLADPPLYAACMIADCFLCAITVHDCLTVIEKWCSIFTQESVSSFDPNALVGTTGVGLQRWVSGQQPLTYSVSFANETNAQVPAQQVIVTNPLGPNVDLLSAGLMGINIPGIQVPIPPTFKPAAGLDEVSTTVDLRPTQSLFVNIDAKLDPANGVITWIFDSIDPATGLPPTDPNVGFLPPGANGGISFTVMPKQGLTTGTQIADQGAVVFDANPPASTNTWTNTLDYSPPASQVKALSAYSCLDFRVSWSGTDVGSGIQDFTVFVSDSGGAFTPWLTNSPVGSATYQGQDGHTYAFYSIARDRVGNVEPPKTAAEATTRVAKTTTCGGPPSLTGSATVQSVSGKVLTLSLKITNNGLEAANNVVISKVVPRVLSGAGKVSFTSPALPISVGNIAAGASTTVSLVLSVPSKVTGLAIAEAGTVEDSQAKSYGYTLGEEVFP